MTGYLDEVAAMLAATAQLDADLAAAEQDAERERRRADQALSHEADGIAATRRQLEATLARARAEGVPAIAPEPVRARTSDPAGQARQLAERAAAALERLAQTRAALRTEEDRLALEAREREAAARAEQERLRREHATAWETARDGDQRLRLLAVGAGVAGLLGGLVGLPGTIAVIVAAGVAAVVARGWPSTVAARIGRRRTGDLPEEPAPSELAASAQQALLGGLVAIASCAALAGALAVGALAAAAVAAGGAAAGGLAALLVLRTHH